MITSFSGGDFSSSKYLHTMFLDELTVDLAAMKRNVFGVCYFVNKCEKEILNSNFKIFVIESVQFLPT